ncbi:hypothetical protein JEZ13_05740 [bacterium]|nr:hypothetical protein [bacterium]
MLNSIEKAPYPDWLKSDIFTFDIKNLLKDSCYYPASWFDGNPVRYLAGNVYSFIYVDYEYTRARIYKETQLGLRGYKLIYQEEISENRLTPSDLSRFVEPDFIDPSERVEKFNHITNYLFRNRPFAIWNIFERKADFTEHHGPFRLSILFLKFEGAFAYQALYLYHKMTPFIMAVIQPGTGFGGNWTSFYAENSILYRSVHYYQDPAMLPTYFVCNSQQWKGYNTLVDKQNRFNFYYGDRVRMNYDGHLFFWKRDNDELRD